MLNKTSILTFLTHSLSASGAIIAMFALEAIIDGQWERAFFWLGLALIIDGIDGPIARRVGVNLRPRFSGARIDLIVDYLNYVFVPVIAFVKFAILPPLASGVLAALILLSSMFHFSDTESKAVDHAFIGFPAIWNVLVFYLFVFQPSPIWTTIVIIIFACLTFVPFRWSHPLRNTRFRPLTLSVTFLASCAALWILTEGFLNAPQSAKVVLTLAALYGLILVALNATIWRDYRGNVRY